MLFAYITWDVDPVIFHIGSFGLRYYSVLYALAFWFGYVLLNKMFKSQGGPEEWADKIFIYTIVGTIVGARLGHCLFYGWDYYSQHPLDILKVWEGGLASHGGAIGILTALYFFNKKVTKKSYLWVVDHMVVVVALAGLFIRTGNLFNSEIVGSPTDVPWAFVFERLHPDERVPRHPSMIYEAIFYFLVFCLLWYMYWKKNAIKQEGLLTGLFLVLVFTFRFFIEFLKADQEEFEANMPINMGQILSIPFVLAGVAILIYSFKKRKAQ